MYAANINMLGPVGGIRAYRSANHISSTGQRASTTARKGLAMAKKASMSQESSATAGAISLNGCHKTATDAQKASALWLKAAALQKSAPPNGAALASELFPFSRVRG
jgi:hypothetical protein